MNNSNNNNSRQAAQPWWPLPPPPSQPSGVNIFESRTFRDDSLTQMEQESQRVNNRNTNKYDDSNNALLHLQSRTLQDVQSTDRLASPIVALSIDRPEIEIKNEFTAEQQALETKQRSENVNNSSNIDVIKKEPQVNTTLTTAIPVVTREENVHQEKELLTWQQSSASNIELTEGAMKQLWENLKESQEKNAQLQRQFAELMYHHKIKNDSVNEAKNNNNNSSSGNNNNNNSNINKTNSTLDDSNEPPAGNDAQSKLHTFDSLMLEMEIAADGYSFTRAMHTLGESNNVFDLSSIVCQWERCLQELEKTQEMEHKRAINDSAVTHKARSEGTSIATMTAIHEETIEETSKLLLASLEAEHFAIAELTKSWVRERKSLISEMEQQKDNMKKMQTRHEVRVRELNEDHIAEMIELQRHMAELEKQLVERCSEPPQSTIVEGATTNEHFTQMPSTATTLRLNTIYNSTNINNSNNNDSSNSQLRSNPLSSELIVATPYHQHHHQQQEQQQQQQQLEQRQRQRQQRLPQYVQRNIIAVNGESQTTLSLEYIRASLQHIHDAKPPRSIRREREHELLELLLREVERLQHVITKKNTLISQLQEQQHRFLSCVTAPLSFTEIEDLLEKQQHENRLLFM